MPNQGTPGLQLGHLPPRVFLDPSIQVARLVLLRQHAPARDTLCSLMADGIGMRKAIYRFNGRISVPVGNVQYRQTHMFSKVGEAGKNALCAARRAETWCTVESRETGICLLLH